MLDNIDDICVEDFLLENLPAKGGHIIITSQVQTWTNLQPRGTTLFSLVNEQTCSIHFSVAFIFHFRYITARFQLW